MEKQIEEMKTALNNYFDNTPMELSFKHENGDTDIITDEKALGVIDAITRQALIPVFCEALYNAGYRKQSDGEWEWFEEWNPSTPEHPRECDDCGWRCGECKTALADIVGGYWDDPDEKPNLRFCPVCGAHMKGGAK